MKTNGRINSRAAVAGTLALVVVATWAAPAPAEETMKREAHARAARGPMSIDGKLSFDLAAGTLGGTVALTNVAYAKDSRLKLADGRSVEATLSGTLTFSGTHGGGPHGEGQGKVVLSGTFSRKDGGGGGTVNGEGFWAGSADALAGVMVIEARWPELKYEGGGAASPDEFWLALPPFQFEPLVPTGDDGSGSLFAHLTWKTGFFAVAALVGVAGLGLALVRARRGRKRTPAATCSDPGCRKPLRTGAKFCPHCGRPTAGAVRPPQAPPGRTCPRCGRRAPAGKNLCAFDGTRLS
jgi:hypothetical protein